MSASNKELIGAITNHIKASYPQLTAEAIVCFLIVAGAKKQMTASEVAAVIGMAEPQTYQHLSSMAPGKGSGLISLINVGDGTNKVQLTPKGADLRDEIEGIAQM